MLGSIIGMFVSISTGGVESDYSSPLIIIIVGIITGLITGAWIGYVIGIAGDMVSRKSASRGGLIIGFFVGIIVGTFQSFVIIVPVPLAVIAGLGIGWILGYLVCISCRPFRRDIRRAS